MTANDLEYQDVSGVCHGLWPTPRKTFAKATDGYAPARPIKFRLMFEKG